MNAMVKGRLSLLVVMAAAVIALLAVACGDDEEEDLSSFATDTPTPAGADVTDAPTGDCPAPIAQAGEPDVTKQYDSKPEMTIDPSKSYAAVIKTERGDITLDLRPDLAPEHVNSFVFLSRDGFYDGVTFHRVEPGFVIQGGDPTGTGSGGPGYTLDAEFSSEPYVRGVLGMARTNDPNSAGSQWFITLGDARFLDNEYTVFGTVSDGMDVVDCIERGDAIVTIEISEQ
jgi:cyclophilin family peptidyl-prolyl cis-trans isomerase